MKIFLDWVWGGTRKPEYSDSYKGCVYVHSKAGDPKVVGGRVFSQITDNVYWAPMAEKTYNRSNLATPEECRDRGGLAHAEHLRAYKELGVKTNFLIAGARGEGTLRIPKSLDDDGWIPGNEPEKEGWYQVSYGNGAGTLLYYCDWRWVDFDSPEMIVEYKYISISEWRIKPEPERELLCPQCGCDINEQYDGEGFTFKCDDCYFRLKWTQSFKEAENTLFKIFDALNPGG